MKKQSGFTLIELVIVIIILGILAATAVPKFVDLQGDARESAMKGVKAALEGAATLTYSRAALDGAEKEASATVNGVDAVFGYPAATQAALTEAAGLSTDDWDFTGTSPIVITADGAASAAQNTTTGCNVQYSAATSVARPTISVENSGC